MPKVRKKMFVRKLSYRLKDRMKNDRKQKVRKKKNLMPIARKHTLVRKRSRIANDRMPKDGEQTFI